MNNDEIREDERAKINCPFHKNKIMVYCEECIAEEIQKARKQTAQEIFEELESTQRIIIGKKPKLYYELELFDKVKFEELKKKYLGE